VTVCDKSDCNVYWVSRCSPQTHATVLLEDFVLPPESRSDDKCIDYSVLIISHAVLAMKLVYLCRTLLPGVITNGRITHDSMQTSSFMINAKMRSHVQ